MRYPFSYKFLCSLLGLLEEVLCFLILIHHHEKFAMEIIEFVSYYYILQHLIFNYHS